MMSEKMCDCPFCGGDILMAGDDFLMGYTWLHDPKSASCPLERTVNDSGYTYSGEAIMREAFTARPIEDALRSELEHVESCFLEFETITDNGLFARVSDVVKALADARSELDKLREQMRWIPVSEKLPEESENVLVFFRAIKVCYRIDNDWYVASPIPHKMTSTVTHWMPLPQPPEEA